MDLRAKKKRCYQRFHFLSICPAKTWVFVLRYLFPQLRE